MCFLSWNGCGHFLHASRAGCLLKACPLFIHSNSSTFITFFFLFLLLLTSNLNFLPKESNGQISASVKKTVKVKVGPMRNGQNVFLFFFVFTRRFGKDPYLIADWMYQPAQDQSTCLLLTGNWSCGRTCISSLYIMIATWQLRFS